MAIIRYSYLRHNHLGSGPAFGQDMLRATQAVRRGVDATGETTSPKPLVIGASPWHVQRRGGSRLITIVKHRICNITIVII